MRKPVIYLYPKTKKEISVSLTLKNAKIAAEYPKSKKGTWNVIANPDGSLKDKNSKKEYSYLFWEAQRKTPFAIDEKKAFCVAGEKCEEFLESSLSRLGLNTKERNDFMVYWLPRLEQNRYNLIEFLEEEYTETAALKIIPKPDTLIRIFMIFRGSDKKVKTNPPKIVLQKRQGFTVVEWGGTDLDEGSQLMQ